MYYKKNYTTTELVERLLGEEGITKKKLAKMLCMSRPTLDSRLSGRSEWKDLENNFIVSLFLD